MRRDEEEEEEEDGERAEIETLLEAKKRRADHSERLRGRTNRKPTQVKRKAHTQSTAPNVPSKRNNISSTIHSSSSQARPPRRRADTTGAHGDADLDLLPDVDIEALFDEELNRKGIFSEDSQDEEPSRIPKKNPRSALSKLNAPRQALASTSALTPPRPQASRPRSAVANNLLRDQQEAADQLLLMRQGEAERRRERHQHAEGDAFKLVGASADSIREALQNQYSTVDAEIKTAVMGALECLDDASAEGVEPSTDGDIQFLAWLTALEDIERDVDDEDGDRSFSVFGHDAIAKYAYRDKLALLKSWGSITNACRLLAALLRIYAMSQAQLSERPNDKNRPCVRTHMGAVCTKISYVFDPLRHQEGEDELIKTKDVQGASQAFVGASQASQGPAIEARPQAKRYMLRDGYVTDASLKKLSKPSALALLEALNVKVDMSSLRRKDDVVARLIEGRNKKEFDISTKDYAMALVGMGQDGTAALPKAGSSTTTAAVMAAAKGKNRA